MNRLMPYPVLVGETVLEVREARLDGMPLGIGMISGGHRVVALHQVERENWEEARLAVELRPPGRELESGSWSDVACFAVLSERRTNARTVTPLRREEDGSWTGTPVLHRDAHLGQVELTGHVTATVGGVAGREIGSTGRSWVVDLQARTPARQNTIKIVSVDFTDPDHPHLLPYKTDPWTVEAAGDEPIVYINTAFEGLAPLLDEGERTIREALSAQIASDAWTALFNAAVYATELEDGQPVWPSGWRGDVLRRLLPDVFPDRSPDDALSEVVATRLNGDGGGDLQTRLVHAAGRHSLVPRRLGGFIRSVNRKERA